MDEFYDKLVHTWQEAFEAGTRNAEHGWWTKEAVDNMLHDAGYVHIPTSKGKNITVYTSDNDEPLMTEQEWREKYNA